MHVFITATSQHGVHFVVDSFDFSNVIEMSLRKENTMAYTTVLGSIAIEPDCETRPCPPVCSKRRRSR